MTRTHSDLTDAVSGALFGVAASPDTAMKIADVEVATRAVAAAVAPIVDHAVNGEPWYQSRVTWGQIVSVAIVILGALGVATDQIDADAAVAFGMAAGSLVGSAITLYGRWRARRPLGR